MVRFWTGFFFIIIFFFFFIALKLIRAQHVYNNILQTASVASEKGEKDEKNGDSERGEMSEKYVQS